MAKQKNKGQNSKAAKNAARLAAEDAVLDAALMEAAAEELVMNAVVRVNNSIDSTKPQTDKKTYRLIELANGMECMLIHDSDDEEEDDEEDESDDEKGSDSDGLMKDDDEQSEEDSDDDDDDEEEGGKEGGDQGKRAGSKRAAAAMAVGVGSWADPKQAQGLAHFLEHMLFMGSSKYPKENEYDAFISKYGGATNAYTECEHTVYHFEIFPRKFNEALDIFAQFFIGKPLFRKDAVEREIQSIESEFNQTKNSDEARMDELLCRTAPDNHPYGNFTWGNQQSLVDEPKANGYVYCIYYFIDVYFVFFFLYFFSFKACMHMFMTLHFKKKKRKKHINYLNNLSSLSLSSHIIILLSWKCGLACRIKKVL